MASVAGPLGFAARLRRPTAVQLLCAMLAGVLLLQVELVFSKSVNWDEFFHFSQIHQHLLGRPAPWLQAPFVALSFWVPALPGDNLHTPAAHISDPPPPTTPPHPPPPPT